MSAPEPRPFGFPLGVFVIALCVLAFLLGWWLADVTLPPQPAYDPGGCLELRQDAAGNWYSLPCTDPPELEGDGA